MKAVFFFTICLFLFTSCGKIEVEPDTTFRRIHGGISQSTGRKIVVQDDGSVLVLGSSSITVRREIQLPTGTPVVEFERRIIPSLARFDQNGSYIQGSERKYPFAEIETGLGNIYIDNGGELLDIIPTSNGFLAIGQWASSRIVVPGYAIDESQPDLPFVLYLDHDFQVDSVRSLNAEKIEEHESEGQLVGHQRAKFISDSQGQNFIITRVGPVRIDDFGSVPFFYSIRKVNSDGSLQVPVFFRSGIFDDFRYSDAMFDGNGNIIVTMRTAFNIFGNPADIGISIIDPASLTLIEQDEVDLVFQRDGVNIVTNTISGMNPMVMVSLGTEGYAITCTAARPGGLRADLFIVDDLFIELRHVELASDVLQVHDIIYTSDEGLVALVELDDMITGNSVAKIIKVNSSGIKEFERIFPGLPRSIVETNDGGLLFVTNPIFNGVEKKLVLTKMDKDGNL